MKEGKNSCIPNIPWKASKRGKEMKLDGKQLIVIGVILVLVYLNIAIASLYMTKSVTMTGGVSAVGAIQVYDSDGVTPLTNIALDNFTPGTPSAINRDFFINNTGNQEVYVHWNMSSSTIAWNNDSLRYYHMENGVSKYRLEIWSYTLHGSWCPSASNSTNTFYLEAGERAEFRFGFTYTDYSNAAETFSLTVTFYAESA
jgi:hypothetical protein